MDDKLSEAFEDLNQAVNELKLAIAKFEEKQSEEVDKSKANLVMHGLQIRELSKNERRRLGNHALRVDEDKIILFGKVEITGRYDKMSGDIDSCHFISKSPSIALPDGIGELYLDGNR